MPLSWGDRLLASLAGPYPARPVAQVRSALGWIAFLRAFEALRLWRRVLPDQRLKVPWTSWLPGPTDLTVGLTLIAWLGAALFFARGVRPRISGSMLATAIVANSALDQQLYSNHLYLMVILVLLISLASPGFGATPAWPVQLAKIQVSVVYLFAALNKFSTSWLSGDVIRRYVGTGLVGPPSFVTQGSVLAAVVIAVELALAFGLWYKPVRQGAVAIGVAFHIAIATFIGPTFQLAVFAGLMFSAYWLFLNPSTQDM